MNLLEEIAGDGPGLGPFGEMSTGLTPGETSIGFYIVWSFPSSAFPPIESLLRLPLYAELFLNLEVLGTGVGSIELGIYCPSK